MASNSIVGPILTDLYQLRMAYVYWKVDGYIQCLANDVLLELPGTKSKGNPGTLTLSAMSSPGSLLAITTGAKRKFVKCLSYKKV